MYQYAWNVTCSTTKLFHAARDVIWRAAHTFFNDTWQFFMSSRGMGEKHFCPTVRDITCSLPDVRLCQSVRLVYMLQIYPLRSTLYRPYCTGPSPPPPKSIMRNDARRQKRTGLLLVDIHFDEKPLQLLNPSLTHIPFVFFQFRNRMTTFVNSLVVGLMSAWGNELYFILLQI